MRRTSRWTSIAAALALGAVGAAAAAEDVTVLNAARIHTMQVDQPTVDAMAFGPDGRILALGELDELVARWPRAVRVDAGPATVVPGLIDAHGHVGNLGVAQMRVRLEGAGGLDEVLERLQAFAAELPPDAWLLGRGWDQNAWPERRFPTAADLDAAFPDRPVWLTRVDGHAGWGNSAAMAVATRDLDGDWQPEGGRIERDDRGRASGVFVGAARQLVESAIPALDAETAEYALALGLERAVAHGLTGVHDPGVPLPQLRAYQALAERDALPLRVYAMADGDGQALDWLCENGLYAHPGGRLQMRAVKIYADGALGSRGAALLEDYQDDPGNRGFLQTPPGALDALLARARSCGVQVATHAIGDRGNRTVLDAYAAAWPDGHDGEHRWRIEHAQVLAPEDLPRLGAQRVIASMQPTHATSDMPWAVERVGPQRILGAYAWRQLRDGGTRLALGSDFPVESVDPRLGLFAAVARTDAQGLPEGGWLPQEKLTAYEALRGFTLDAAYAGFAEDEVGSLAVGKRADFVLLAQDPLAVPPEALPGIAVQATWVDGREVYRAGDQQASPAARRGGR